MSHGSEIPRKWTWKSNQGEAAATYKAISSSLFFVIFATLSTLLLLQANSNLFISTIQVRRASQIILLAFRIFSRSAWSTSHWRLSHRSSRKVLFVTLFRATGSRTAALIVSCISRQMRLELEFWQRCTYSPARSFSTASIFHSSAGKIRHVRIGLSCFSYYSRVFSLRANFFLVIDFLYFGQLWSIERIFLTGEKKNAFRERPNSSRTKLRKLGFSEV